VEETRESPPGVRSRACEIGLETLRPLMESEKLRVITHRSICPEARYWTTSSVRCRFFSVENSATFGALLTSSNPMTRGG
jgi:hypothetical protein